MKNIVTILNNTSIVVISFLLIVFLCYFINKLILILHKKIVRKKGTCFDVNDFKMYGEIKGEGKVSVVIIPAIGTLGAEWAGIAEKLSKNFRVLVYERSGYGPSSKTNEERDSAKIIEELKIFIELANLPKPLFLIGSDTGALYMQHFARAYQKEVAGVAFIDPMHLDRKRYSELVTDNKIGILSYKAKLSKIISKKGLFISGLPRIFTFFIRIYIALKYKGVDLKNQNIIYNAIFDVNKYDTIMAESDDKIFEKSNKQIMMGNRFPDKPTLIINHSPQKMIKYLKMHGVKEKNAMAIEEEIDYQNRALCALVGKSEYVFAENSIKDIHLNEAKFLADKITEFINKYI